MVGGFGIFILCLCAALPSTFAADPLDSVFARIDAAAKTFKGMTADISNTSYTAVVDNKDVTIGTIKLLLAKDGTHMLVDFKDGQVISLDPHMGRVYNPKTKVVDQKDLTGNQDLVNQYMLLGFGATSAALKATYNVTWVGTEQVGGQQTSHIALVPKPAEIRKNMKQADLWISDRGLVVQQKRLQPSGDYQLVTYSNMVLVALPEKDLELKLPKDAIIQKH
jgi:outer membrane lipoprotein-sorting protein